MALSDGDIVTAVITFTHASGNKFQNKFTHEYSGAGFSDSSLIGLMDSWFEDFYEDMAAQMFDDITSFVSEYNKIVWNDTLNQWEVSYNIGTGSGNVTFTNTSEILPFQCCPTLVGFTGVPKVRGRKSIPLFCEDQQTNSSWGTAAVTALGVALSAYLSTVDLGGGHSMTPGVASSVAEAFEPFLSGLVNNIVFTQRRRTKGRGI